MRGVPLSFSGEYFLTYFHGHRSDERQLAVPLAVLRRVWGVLGEGVRAAERLRGPPTQ